MIGKFIYDTYLTNNTEKDWEEYKRKYPHEAKVVETNKGLNLRTRANIRTDGYYVSRFDGPSFDGQNVKLTQILIFNDLGYVYYEDMEGHPEFDNEEMIKVLESFIGKDELNYNSGKIKLDQSGSIDIIMFDPEHYDNKESEEPLNYQRFQGTVITNGLTLDYKQKHFNQSLKKYNEHNVLADIKFEFFKVNFN